MAGQAHGGLMRRGGPRSIAAMASPHRVFAYGSNMHRSDLLRWHEANRRAVPTIFADRPAVLENYSLAWNFYSTGRRGGAANVEPQPGDRVCGLVLEIDDVTLLSLDEKEGYPDVYDRMVLPVTVHDGTQLSAWVYRVTATHCSTGFVPPHRAYLSLLLEAARSYGFDPAYIDILERLQTVTD